jgi:protoheme IX farnesyltransferase
LPASLVPTAIGMSGWPYFAIALVLGIALLWLAARFARARTDSSARTLVFASIAYLPLLWIAMIVNHGRS